MVLATRSTTVDLVVDAVSRAYVAAVGTAVVGDDMTALDVPGRSVVAPDLGVVECVVDDDEAVADIGPAVSRLAAAGWAVTVLVPSARLGEAHRDLRGRPAMLQGWWIEDGSPHFGGHEIP